MAIGRYVQHDFIRANFEDSPLHVQAVYSPCFSSVGFSEARLKKVIRCTYKNRRHVNIHTESSVALSKGGGLERTPRNHWFARSRAGIEL